MRYISASDSRWEHRKSLPSSRSAVIGPGCPPSSAKVRILTMSWSQMCMWLNQLTTFRYVVLVDLIMSPRKQQHNTFWRFKSLKRLSSSHNPLCKARSCRCSQTPYDHIDGSSRKFLLGFLPEKSQAFGPCQFISPKMICQLGYGLTRLNSAFEHITSLWSWPQILLYNHFVISRSCRSRSALQRVTNA